MPRRGQRDDSPGDGRKPFSDRGGPAGKHAETHDVRREALTNPKGPQPTEDFAADIAPDTSTIELRGHADESESAADDKVLHQRLNMLTNDELARIAVVERGTRLDQGATYIDLNDLDRGPFKALGADTAGAEHRYVAKRDLDYEMWNRLTGIAGDDTPEIERPVPAGDAQAREERELEASREDRT